MPDPFSLSFGLTFEQAIAQALARDVVLPAEFYGDLQTQAQRGAFTVSSIESVDQIQAILDSLTEAIAAGQTFIEWQESAGDAVAGLSDARQELVFRNAVQTAYSVGQTVEHRENKIERPFLMWSAINDSRTRPTHHAMDGFIAPVDDPTWRVWSVPAGFGCRCSRISLTEEQALMRGYPMPGRAVQPDPGFGYEKADAGTAPLESALQERATFLPAAIRNVIGRLMR